MRGICSDDKSTSEDLYLQLSEESTKVLDAVKEDLFRHQRNIESLINSAISMLDIGHI
ncbi:uncharacterized protein PHALS_07053 [Plasmopara halstedii]|uniref:Uncharacterized protein n=1 Tax=Plasmopara halstedii TaxID=4781 RepID=A0A0P1B463_PLAHL|nr:uncharacterized protein PHALS_07053 [Plasmopara halstedii]CEG49282.1 hypothetical protein PHALS_07053 [Plasmopara halstedii]|eukprot:XP_024585651.1 hypothetical protein PHALS_07053 [Plasmopara halstedii]